MPFRQLLNWPCSLHTRGIYKLAVAAYRFGSPSLAGVFFGHYLRLVGKHDLVATRSTNGCPNNANYHDFEKAFGDFLERRWASWETGDVPLPAYLLETAATEDRVSTKLRVLVVMPRYLQSSDRYLEYDLIDHTYRSMLNVGIAAEMFDADRISYPALFRLDEKQAVANLASLRKLVDETRPHVMLFDANFVGQSGALDAAYLSELQSVFGLKPVGFIGDAWGDYGRRAVEYWSPVCDLIIHLVPDLDARGPGRDLHKLMSIPYPVNENNFYPETHRTLDLSFFGSRQTYLRLFWLARIRTSTRSLHLRSNLQATRRTNDCPSMPEYAAIMRGSKMVVNFATRNAATKIITGRVWQALHSGIVLLEEENEATKCFFVPFIHYIPFENARQLRHMIEFFSKNALWERRIGQAAAQFCADHYSAASIWAKIFARADVSVEAGARPVQEAR